MLESPQDESVVRWGNEGDSFVVLEVSAGQTRELARANAMIEREVHEAHTTQAFQTQQFCQLRTAAEQVRLP